LELTFGLPVFFDQLREALQREAARRGVDHSALARTASHHGHDLSRQGITVAQVVRDYGDLCQVISALAMEQSASITAVEFRTLNLRLDDAIAGRAGPSARHRPHRHRRAQARRSGQAQGHRSRALLRPFIQQGRDRTGLGLGLAICVKAAHSMNGERHIRDLEQQDQRLLGKRIDGCGGTQPLHFIEH
jgi:hypothetical protein